MEIEDEKEFHSGFGDWGHVSNNSEKTIRPELDGYFFDDEIKNVADSIYNKMVYQVRRGKVRTKLIFYCIYCAHLELKRDVNPTQLGKIFGLTQGEVQKCDSLFSPLQTGYRAPTTIISPLQYLPGYCIKLKLSQESLETIRKMSQDILSKDPSLKEENPQTVASGLLRYYTLTNGITLDDPNELEKLTSRSMVTIENMCKRISVIDNT
jgi:hypothetical protein